MKAHFMCTRFSCPFPASCHFQIFGPVQTENDLYPLIINLGGMAVQEKKTVYPKKGD